MWIYIYKKVYRFRRIDLVCWLKREKKKKKKIVKAMTSIRLCIENSAYESVPLPWERALVALENYRATRFTAMAWFLIFPVSRSRRFDFRSGGAIERTKIPETTTLFFLPFALRSMEISKKCLAKFFFFFLSVRLLLVQSNVYTKKRWFSLFRSSQISSVRNIYTMFIPLFTRLFHFYPIIHLAHFCSCFVEGSSISIDSLTKYQRTEYRL